MKNKPTIIVTGATRGIGLNFCKYISKLSWNIILLDISEKAFSVYKENTNLSNIKKDLQNNNNVSFHFCDLTIEKNVTSFFKRIKKEKIFIDGLVNFAGGDIKGNDTKASGGKPKNNNIFINTKDFKNVYERNYLSTYLMCKEYIKLNKNQKKKNKIVNVSSISGTYGVTNEFAYSSAKSNIIYLTRSLASYARKFNINY